MGKSYQTRQSEEQEEDLESEEEFEEAYTPTEEETAGMNAFIALSDAHPICVLLLKVVQRHSRVRRLLELEAPECLTEECVQLRDRALNELCEAFPFYADTNTYSLAGIIANLQAELLGISSGKRAD